MSPDSQLSKSGLQRDCSKSQPDIIRTTAFTQMLVPLRYGTLTLVIIINAIRNSWVRITDHADEEAFDDNLTYEEIYSSVLQGEVIKIVQMISRIRAV